MANAVLILSDVVLIHDDGLGRSTNIAEYQDRIGRSAPNPLFRLKFADVYSPFTGRGYNPLVKDVPWKGVIEKVHLKNEYGDIW